MVSSGAMVVVVGVAVVVDLGKTVVVSVEVELSVLLLIVGNIVEVVPLVVDDNKEV